MPGVIDAGRDAGRGVTTPLAVSFDTMSPTRLFSLAVFCIVALAATAGLSAQEPRYTVLVPEDNALSMRATVGGTAKRLVIVARFSPEVQRLKLGLPDAPFFLDNEVVEFTDGDTVKFEVTFKPTRKGFFTDTLTLTDGSHRTSIVLFGETERDEERWSLLTEAIDFGVMESDETGEGRFGLQNSSNEPVVLRWNRPVEVFTTHRPGQGPSAPTLEVRINPGETAYVTVIAHGARALPGPNVDTLEISDGRPFNIKGETVQRLPLKVFLGDTTADRPGRLVFIPRAINFPTQPAPGTTTTTSRALLMYAGRGYARVGQLSLAGMSARNFTFTSSPLPKNIYPGDTVVVDVTYDHAADPFARATLIAKALFFDGPSSGVGGRVDAAGLILFSGDTTTARGVTIAMDANNANSGEISTTTFTTQTTLPQELDHAVVSLRYNATVMAPITTPLDTEDPIEEGYRTSRFRLDLADRAEGARIGTVEFRLALGNAASTPLDVVGFDWFNLNDQRVTINTSVNNTTITVLDAAGNEVNVDPGPLSLLVTPSVITADATVTYSRGELPATLKLYDQLGSMVMDYTSLLQGASGSFSISASTLPSGVYLLHLTGGRYAYVIRMLVE